MIMHNLYFLLPRVCRITIFKRNEIPVFPIHLSVMNLNSLFTYLFASIFMQTQIVNLAHLGILPYQEMKTLVSLVS